MPGLRTLCKLYGRLKAGNIVYYWDFARNEPCPEKEWTKERQRASEKARYTEPLRGTPGNEQNPN